MTSSLIKKNFLGKIKLFKKYNKYYYEKNKSVITDQEFDILKKDIIDLENKYKFLNSEKSPSKLVGFKPSKVFKKVKHKAPMLSLGNAFEENDLKTFEKKIVNFLSHLH